MESRPGINRGILIVIGVVVIFAGVILTAYNENVPMVGIVYRYQLVGVIFLLIGFLTLVIGFAIPENPLLEGGVPMKRRPEECEYLSAHALDNPSCRAIAESDEKRIAREKSCANELKDHCCYFCKNQESCTVSCQYLCLPESAQKPMEEHVLEDAGQEIAKCKERMEELANLFAEGKISKQSYAVSSKALEKRMDRLAKGQEKEEKNEDR